jgi:RecB family exonuclease
VTAPTPVKITGREPITVSFSEIDTIRQCLFKHELGYKQRWRTDRTSPALQRGTDWHQILEVHYGEIRQWQQEQDAGVVLVRDAALAERIWARVHPLLYDTTTGHQTDEQALLEWMYRGYIDAYGLDPQWDILAVEHAPVMWLPTPGGRRSRFQVKMKIDLVVRDRPTGQILVVDHKSGKDLPKDKELDLDDQFGLYVWGLRQLGYDVFGAVHSAARTLKYKDESKAQPLTERFSRKRLPRTDRELQTIAVEAYRAARLAYSFKEGEAPRSPNSDTCNWRCDFKEACLLGRKGSNTQAVLRDLGFTQDFTRH